MVELLLLKEIAETQDVELLLKTEPKWFLEKKASNLYSFLRKYYNNYNKIPTVEELIALNKGKELLELPKTNLKNYLLENLIDRYNKNTLYEKLYKAIEDSEDMSFAEVTDTLSEIFLGMSEEINSEEEVVKAGEVIAQETLRKKPLGLGQFDIVNKGMAPSELMLLGGHRGTGKSILALNLGLFNFNVNKESVALISLEMRKEEVLSRIDSIISGVEAIRILTNDLTLDEYYKIYTARAKTFRDKSTPEFEKFKGAIESGAPLNVVESLYKQIPFKENKFLVIDSMSASMSKIHYNLIKAKQRYNISLAIVDYLNIIVDTNSNDLYDWKSQTMKSNNLKTFARTMGLKIVAPFQTSEEGAVKYAKSIEDPVDYSIIFKKKDSSSNILNLYTSKIRNGQHLRFNLQLDPKTLRVSPLGGRDEPIRNIGEAQSITQEEG